MHARRTSRMRARLVLQGGCVAVHTAHILYCAYVYIYSTAHMLYTHCTIVHASIQGIRPCVHCPCIYGMLQCMHVDASIAARAAQHKARLVLNVLQCMFCSACVAVHVLQRMCCSACVAVHVLQCMCCSACVAVHVLQCMCCSATYTMIDSCVNEGLRLWAMYNVYVYILCIMFINKAGSYVLYVLYELCMAMDSL
jgi:hypothetical protein